METCLDLTETKRKETTSLNIEDIKIYKEVEKVGKSGDFKKVETI